MPENPHKDEDERRESVGDGDAASQPLGAAFFQQVMTGLSDTNFARGWADPTMYRDFLAWCEGSDEADDIIARFSPDIPTLLMDSEENVRLISLHATVAAELMRALLERYEQRRIEEFLSR